jgi:predicted phosphodiesterase
MGTRLLVLSDLHLESISSTGIPGEDDIVAQSQEIDAVVLAGDIAYGTDGMAWAQKQFENVPLIYVAGNHEAYFSSVNETNEKLASTAMTTGSNVRFLQMSESQLEGVRFLGATLGPIMLSLGLSASRPA